MSVQHGTERTFIDFTRAFNAAPHIIGDDDIPVNLAEIDIVQPQDFNNIPHIPLNTVSIWLVKSLQATNPESTSVSDELGSSISAKEACIEIAKRWDKQKVIEATINIYGTPELRANSESMLYYQNKLYEELGKIWPAN